MGPSRDGEADDPNLNYPSPGAETMDTGPFYNTNGREDTQEPHEHTEQHVEDHMPGTDDHSHLHTEEDSQHVSRPDNLEELQLAAQLGQGLAGAGLLPTTDPNMGVDETGMRSIMPHPEPDHRTPSYVHDTPTSDHMVQHSIQVPVGPPLGQYNMGDGVPPRKRSKVSRACDECRRKKIKCDAQSDTGEAPCSSCARSAIRCLFSRVPQKRGPSKGYIKELADRINSIESKLESDGGVSQDEIDKLFSSERHRGTNGTTSVDDASRKRPYSSISNEFSTPAPNRQAPWGSEPRSLPPDSAHSNTYYHNSSLAPQPSAVNDTPSKPAHEEVDDLPMEDGEYVPNIDEGVLNDFLNSVQPLYPILATTKTRQQALLAQCPLSVRTAFEIALLAVGQSTAGDVQQANALLHDWESSEAPRTRATDIVHAQTLLLLIIDADWRSVSTLPFLLSRAVGLANSMKLWKLPAVDPAAETDSNEALCTRIWWSLIGMDRWYAAGTGKPAQIPDNSVVAPAGLEAVVGETCFYFTRLSKLLNRISFVISHLPTGVATADPPMAAILGDYIENYREDLPAHMDAGAFPLIHLAYWHCKLLVTLITPGSTTSEALWPTKEVTQLLLATPHLRSPLVNHYVSLATMSITTLSRSERARDEALALARDVVDGGTPQHWAGVRDRLSEVLRPPTSSSASAAAASQGLQHLADLATAHEGIAPAEGDAAVAAAAAAVAAAAATASLATGYLEVA
ncbi:Fungal transcriptional regulatory protein [Cordyceps fumosorosea ARSEF 2679]|uniref:Fungal transcriptional regulatory protein n=1 Tax=Cordyceps fumosorosea (strain ARSEF 2679) TaxID=1081104 RepID=A0A168BTX5_CORFA|nr:Fungal transcriptional regulatory protein [Cordyceps fumosorosea ARSEF 2679]OAA70546.1 Fungal transcriptional regulatory protein [Cordyceps fumosorosea ARSEF 2679]